MLHGKKYQKMIGKISSGKLYSMAEAIDLAKNTSYGKFDGSIELHVRLTGRKKEDRQLRAPVSLPHGTGKSQRIVVLDEGKIEEILKTNKAAADVYLASPELMPKVAKVAKILGPKGKMPNPKSGTVTTKTAERVKELSSENTIEIRSDAAGIIHVGIGKASWESLKLLANAEAVMKIVPRAKIGSVTLCATMGPGIKVQA